jgi:hypothetical protein
MNTISQRIVRRLLRLLTCRIETTLIYCHDLHAIPQVSDNSSLSIRELTEAEVTVLLDVGHIDIDEARLRLQRGDICVLCFAENRLAHYSWIQIRGRHPITSARQSCDVTSRQIWIYNCRTAEWARGRRIYPAVLSFILSKYKQQSAAIAWIYTTKWNEASQRGIERSGFRVQGCLRAIVLGPVAIPLPPRVSFFTGLSSGT